jgi:hypothetical protein
LETAIYLSAETRPNIKNLGKAAFAAKNIRASSAFRHHRTQDEQKEGMFAIVTPAGAGGDKFG